VTDIDPLRMRLALEDPVPVIVVKRFAPYPVWMSLRLLTMLAGWIAIAWFLHATYAIVRAVDGVDVGFWPIWIFVVAVIIGGKTRGEGGNLPAFGELVGNLLASKQCPSCGQSIFDHTPPSGYEPDITRRSWWPSRCCTNCGHDMSKRTAE